MDKLTKEITSRIFYAIYGEFDNLEHPLKLTQLSQITDEEATELGKLRFGPNSEITSIKRLNNGSLEYTFRVPKFETVHTQWIMEKSLHSNEADFLRGKGFAVPFNGLSVEDLVNRGWVKLKEVSNG